MATQRASGSLLVLLGVSLSLWACGPVAKDATPRGLVAELQAEDGSVIRGNPGRVQTARLTLKNVGDTAVALHPIEALGGAAVRIGGDGPAEAIFAVGNPDRPSLEPGAQTELEIRFSPPREGRFVSAVRVNTVAVTLVGVAERAPTASHPELVLLSGSTFSFGRVPLFPAVPAASVRRVWVTNRGTQAAAIERASVRSLNPNSTVEELEVRIPEERDVPAHAPESAFPIELRVMPAGLGTKQWEVSLTTSDPNAPVLLIAVNAEAVTPSPCHLAIRPTHLDFGIVFPPDPRDVEVEIANEGWAPDDFCIVWDVQLAAGSDPAFLLPSGPSDASVIGPGSSLSIPIRFFEAEALPGASFERSGRLTFRTSAEALPSVEVPITALRPASGCLAVAPVEIDYGTLHIGCQSATRSFNVYNSCSDEVLLTGIRMLTEAEPPPGSGPEFLLVASPSVPAGGQLLPPGEAVGVQVKYRPMDVGPDTAAVALDVRVGQSPQTHVIALHGRGGAWATQTDVFVNDPLPQNDVLFVIDDSTSMANHQASIAANLGAYLQYAIAVGADFRLAVVTATASGSTTLLTGLGHPDAVLTRWTPDLTAQFAAKVNVGSGGVGGPRCLERAHEVLVANPNFVRPSASLDVVCISDSADVSPLPVSDYVNALWGIKGEYRKTLFTFNAIGGFSPGCPGDSGRLADAVTQTNGVKDDLCTPDWGKTLQWLYPVWFGFRTAYFLTSVPDLGRGPIEISIEGQPVPPFDSKGLPIWRYDGISNSVDFAPMYVPEPGTTLVITYPTSCFL